MTTPFPLGRVVEHDERSRAFPAPATAAVQSVFHRHYGPVLDQGQLGSCTGNAAAQAMNSRPFHRKGTRLLKESDAVSIYSQATVLDGIPGSYPPEDTGSSGLAVAKVLQKSGLVSGYTHAFGFEHFCAAIQAAPLLVGISWHDSMFKPDLHGFVSPNGEVVGGHEILAIGLSIEKQYVEFLNSWSNRWGLAGRFRMSFADFSALLADHGDATQLMA